MSAESSRWGWVRSIRFRVTAAATIVVVVLLALMSTVFVRALERRVQDNTDAALADNAAVVQRSIEVASPQVARRVAGALGYIVQVVDRSGEVVDGTVLGREVPALIDVTTIELDAGQTYRNVERADVGSLRVLAEPVDGRGALLMLGRNTEQGDEAVESLVRLGRLALVLAALVLAWVIWWVVGRALRPVEDVRRAAAAVSEHDLSQRLPVPDTEDNVARLVETMNDMLERVEATVDRERRFVADASHELRSPLAGARALLESVDDDTAGTVRLDTLDTVARLEAMVEQLLDLARSEGATGSPALRPVDLDELVLAQAGRLQRTTELTIDVAGVSGGRVLGRENDLGRLIENLTANAVRHARSQVAMRVGAHGDTIVLAVSDDGPGVPPSERERIFQRFARVDDARTRNDGGAGLGLAIVDAIARDHGATTEVRDGELGGAEFVVRFPASESAPTQ